MIMDSMLLVYYQVSLLLSLLQTLLGRLSSAGKNTYSNIILILLWYVQLYNHAACSSASAQNSVPNLAKYIIHISYSFLFNALRGLSPISFCDDESAAAELTS